MNKITWTLEDHLCRSCGGRILKSASGIGMSPGGNPLFRCSDCGVSQYSMQPDDVCWCGMKHKHQHMPAYRCVPYLILKEHPELLQSFLSCGCDPKRGGDVGIMLMQQLRDGLSAQPGAGT